MKEDHLKELSRKVDDQINELEKINQRLSSNFNFDFIEGDFYEAEKFLSEKLFVSIDEISLEIKKATEIEIVRSLQSLYGRAYRATIVYLNCKISVMGNYYSSEINKREEKLSEIIKRNKLDSDISLLPPWIPIPWGFA